MSDSDDVLRRMEQGQQVEVDPTVLFAAGYGQYQPIAPNDAPENRSLNRRIEIVLAPKAGGR